jgi:hypothetical protein
MSSRQISHHTTLLRESRNIILVKRIVQSEFVQAVLRGGPRAATNANAVVRSAVSDVP